MSRGWYELTFDLRAETPPGPPPPVEPPGPCEASDPTPTASWAPNNGYASISPGNIFYDQIGGVVDPPIDGPHIGWSSGVVGFPVWGAGGSPDQLGDCIGNFVQINVVGAGELTVQCAQGTGDRTLTMTLYHKEGAINIADETRSGLDPDATQVFDVSTHDGVECYHWLNIRDTGGSCGHKWNFVGASWVSTE